MTEVTWPDSVPPTRCRRLRHTVLLGLALHDIGFVCTTTRTDISPCIAWVTKLTALLRTVLHLAIPERPVLLRNFHEIDDHVFLAETQPGKIVCEAPVERFFHIHCSPVVQGDLDQDQIPGVADAEVLRGQVTPFRWMARDELELVARRYADDFHHGLVDCLADPSRRI